MKILVVDDDFMSQEMLITLLEEYGACDGASDGGEALEKYYGARNSGTPYDLICLDAIMPIRNGSEVLAEIRRAEAESTLKSCIFIITSHESPELVEGIDKADDFISKPCSANLIRRLIERHHLQHETLLEKYHVLIISAEPETRHKISRALCSQNLFTVECGSFVEAEQVARINSVSAVIVDMLTITRSKDGDRLAASSLQNIYSLVRIKMQGDNVLPIIMKQEERSQGVLNYIERICATFHPRRLRLHRRHNLLLPVIIHRNDVLEHHTFTHNISWSGAFIVMNNSGELTVGNSITVEFPTLQTTITAEIVRIKPWGIQGSAPGLGVKWSLLEDESLSLSGLAQALKSHAGNDPDRLLC